MFGWSKKSKYEVLPERGYSYAMNDETREPMATYYYSEGVFGSVPVTKNAPVFFLNIRRPVIIDMDGNKIGLNDLPSINDFPDECDGFIFKNVGKYKSTIFLVRNPKLQSMSF